MRAKATLFVIPLLILLSLGVIEGGRYIGMFGSRELTPSVLTRVQHVLPLAILVGMVGLVALLNWQSRYHAMLEQIRRAVAYEDPLPDTPVSSDDGVLPLESKARR